MSIHLELAGNSKRVDLQLCLIDILFEISSPVVQPWPTDNIHITICHSDISDTQKLLALHRIARFRPLV
jgi:hypothetical protein